MGTFLELTHEQETKALEIHREAIIIDGSNASAMDTTYFDKLKSSGVTGVVAVTQIEETFRESVRALASLYSSIQNSPKVLLATKAEDIENAKKNGEVAVIVNFHSANAIEDDISLLEIFYKLGVRIMQLTFNARNLVGDGCGERTNCGLSNFGVEVVKEMNRLGMLIDLSHCSDATVMDTLSVSKDPVIFSHSNARSLCNNPRNKTNEQIQALAEKGGVIGVVASASFLSNGPAETMSIENLLDHIDYIVKLVGVNHVGIGLDFYEGKNFGYFRQKWGKVYPYLGRKPKDIDSITKLINITKGLVARGYSKDEIKKILGTNFLRIFRRVWK